MRKGLEETPDPLIRDGEFLEWSLVGVLYHPLHVFEDVTENAYTFIEFLSSCLHLQLSAVV